MKTMKEKIIIILSIGLILLQYSGCTLIGFGIGYYKDTTKSDYIFASVDELKKLEKGTGVVVVKKNMEKVEGLFRGIQCDEDEYADF